MKAAEYMCFPIQPLFWSNETMKKDCVNLVSSSLLRFYVGVIEALTL